MTKSKRFVCLFKLLTKLFDLFTGNHNTLINITDSRKHLNTKNATAEYLNLRLKFLNASNSEVLFCDLVTFNSKPFNFVLCF